MFGTLFVSLGMMMGQTGYQAPSYFASERDGCGYGYTTGMRDSRPGYREGLLRRFLRPRIRPWGLQRWNGVDPRIIYPRIQIRLDVRPYHSYLPDYE